MVKRSLALLCTLTWLALPGCGDDSSTGKRDAGPDQGSDARPDRGVDIGPDGMITPDTGGPCTLTFKSFTTGLGTVDAATKTSFSSADDLDSTKAGVQVDVLITVMGTPDGTKVTLKGKDTATAASSKNQVEFKGFTIDTASSLPVLDASATGSTCSGAKLYYNVIADPSCSIQSPATGTTLTPKDNTNTKVTPFTYDVVVQTLGATNGQVDLEVNSKPAQPLNTLKTNTLGAFRFSDTVLTSGTSVSNTIKATVKVPLSGSTQFLTSTCTSTVTVNTSAPKCDCCTFSPTASQVSTTPGWGLGKMPVTVTVDTDTTLVDQVTLQLGTGGVTLLAKPQAGKAVFSNVTIPEGTQTLTATCSDTKNKNSSTDPFQILVDTKDPSPVTLSCKATGNRTGEITCTWTTVGSDVKTYHLHYLKNSTITSSTFDSTAAVKTQVVPALAGKSNAPVVKGLAMPNSYSFAVMAEDHLGHKSTLSNESSAKLDYNVAIIDGPNTGGQFGAQIVVGDFNCDGKSDVAVGESSYSNGVGQVYLYFGTGKGLPSTYSKSIKGTEATGYFGANLAALNFDKDALGCADLAVLAFGAGSYKGRVYLYLGRPTWSDREDSTTGKGAEIIYQMPASTTFAQGHLGIRLGAADMNGDGADDLAMGHVDKSVASAKVANVLVDYGESGITLMGPGQVPAARVMPASADIKVTGADDKSLFGYALDTGGRLNSDAYDELLIGASATKVGGSKVGAAYVVLGAASSTSGTQEVLDITTSSRVVPVLGASTNVAFGQAVAGLGDLNGDGTAEFAVGDYQLTAGGYSKAGQLYVFNLGSKTSMTSADATFKVVNDLTSATNSYLGRAIASGASVDPVKGADLDKDGFADIAVSAVDPASSVGMGLVYLGHTGTLTDDKVSTADFKLAPTSATLLFSVFTAYMDYNGDGYVDILVTDPNYSSSRGRVYIFY